MAQTQRKYFFFILHYIIYIEHTALISVRVTNNLKQAGVLKYFVYLKFKCTYEFKYFSDILVLLHVYLKFFKL